MRTFEVRSAVGHRCLTTIADGTGLVDLAPLCSRCRAHMHSYDPKRYPAVASAAAPRAAAGSVLRAAGINQPKETMMKKSEVVPAPPSMIAAARAMRGLAAVEEPPPIPLAWPTPRVATKRTDAAPPPPSMEKIARELLRGDAA